ncbi:MAG: hypothetical protein ACXU8S_13130 [Phenylobacterium sp.]
MSALVVVGLPLTSWIYWPLVLKSNVLSPEADTIIIPMMNSVILAVLALPLVLLMTWLCQRRRLGIGRIFGWDRHRPVLSIAVTAAAMLPLACCLVMIWAELTAPKGWHGMIWLPYTFVIIIWLLLLRASSLSQMRPRG